MAFKFVIADTKRFSSVIDVVELLVDEVLLCVSSEGVVFTALDKPHTSFVNVELGVDYFVDYTVGDPNGCEVLVDTLQLKQVLHRGGSDELTVEYDQDNEKLNLVFTGVATKKFSINLISDDYEPPSMPDIPYSVCYEVSWKALKDSLGDAGLYEDKVKLSNREGLGVESHGDFGDYTTVIQSIDQDQDNDGSTTALYSLEKIKDTFKLNLSDYVTVEYGQDMPVLLTWKSDDETAKVEYLLAPRIEEDV